MAQEEIFEDSVDLLSDERGVQYFYAGNAGGVLNGYQRDDGGAVDAELVESFEVGLNARAAGGVGAGDGEAMGRGLIIVDQAGGSTRTPMAGW